MTELEILFDRLFPVCRSISGDGVRETLEILQEYVPLRRLSFKTGEDVLDWTVPQEWKISQGYVKDSNGNVLIDFVNSNLHVIGYSEAFSGKIKGSELKKHIYTLEDMPNAIPYVTSYYEPKWGFCCEYECYKKINDNELYEVLIDADKFDGEIILAEGYIKGELEEEILFSTYTCHPSMANNEVSGLLVQTEIFRSLLERKNKFSYRFLYLPETIGSIAYLSKYGSYLKEKVRAGYVVTCIGDTADFTYKRSRRYDSLADKAALRVLKESGRKFTALDWAPLGSDERQYCSQEFDLPIGSLMRSMYGTYKEYHTSLDNKSLMDFSLMKESVEMYLKMVNTLETEEYYQSMVTAGEAHLSKYGILYIGDKEKSIKLKQILYLLAFSDGNNSIRDIAERMEMNLDSFQEIVSLLVEKKLLAKKY